MPDFGEALSRLEISCQSRIIKLMDRGRVTQPQIEYQVEYRVEYRVIS